MPRFFAVCVVLTFCEITMADLLAQDAAGTAPSQEAASPAASVTPEAAFEARVFRSPSGGALPYRLLKPLEGEAASGPAEPDEKLPLVLFLHGAGERGDDNVRQLIHGAKAMVAPGFRQRYRGYVLMPQCPAEKKWVEVPWEADAHAKPEEPSESMALVFEIIDALREEFPIDGTRIYGTGLSMGGYGVWDILARKPELLAAAAPICGGGDPAQVAVFKSTPVWAFHGDADMAVKVGRSREMVAAMKAAGGRPIYTEYAGVGHDSWTATYQNQLLWDWMFAQRQKYYHAKTQER